MPKVDVYDMKGEVAGSIELSDSIFAVEINEPVMHAAVVNYLANQRQGTQSALTREGHGPRPPGLHPRAPVGRRRRSVRSQAPRLRIQAQQEDQTPGPEVRPFRQAEGRRARGCQVH